MSSVALHAGKKLLGCWKRTKRIHELEKHLCLTPSPTTSAAARRTFRTKLLDLHPDRPNGDAARFAEFSNFFMEYEQLRGWDKDKTNTSLLDVLSVNALVAKLSQFTRYFSSDFSSTAPQQRFLRSVQIDEMCEAGAEYAQELLACPTQEPPNSNLNRGTDLAEQHLRLIFTSSVAEAVTDLHLQRDASTGLLVAQCWREADHAAVSAVTFICDLQEEDNEHAMDGFKRTGNLNGNLMTRSLFVQWGVVERRGCA